MTSSSVRRLYFELVAYRRHARGAEGGGALRPLSALLRPAVLDELEAAGAAAERAGHQLRVAPLVELTPDRPRLERDLGILDEVSRALGRRDVGLDVWVQIGEDGTRFLNTSTAGRYLELMAPLLGALRALKASGPEVGLCLDMEPSEALLRAAYLAGRPWGAKRALPGAAWAAAQKAWGHVADRHRGQADLEALDDEVERVGVPVHVAVLPPLTPHLEGSAGLRGRLLGCPSTRRDGRLLFGRHAPMAYATLLRRPLGRAHRDLERRTVETWARRHRAFVETRTRADMLAVALGQLGQGVMGDEPVYATSAELLDDVGAVTALGYKDLSFFCLEGLLYGPNGRPLDDDFVPQRPDRDAWWAAILG